MFGKKKKLEKLDPTVQAKDGTNSYVTFETTTHAEAGCPNSCDGDHVRVGVHGCRPNLDKIPYEQWTTPEVLATAAAEYIATRLTIQKTEPKGFEH